MNDFFQHCPSSARTENPSRSAAPLLTTGKAGWAGTERRQQEHASSVHLLLHCEHPSKSEHSTSGQTIKKAPNAALERPKLVPL